MATLKWDHTVHYVNDLETAINTFKENGLIAFKGGSHTQWGTYNALSYFGLSYIEFLGIEDQELAKKAASSNVVVKDALAILPEHEAFSRVVIRTDDIDETASFLKEKGLELTPIIDGKRLNAQGQLIEWRMVMIKGDYQGLVYPFVIQWKGTDAERLENLTASGIVQPHFAGETTIKHAIFYVSNPAGVAEHWQSLFGLAAEESEDATVTLKIGEQLFIFKQGEDNQLKQMGFNTEAKELKGKTITIGEAEYIFS